MENGAKLRPNRALSLREAGDASIVDCETGRIEVSWHSPSIVHVAYYPKKSGCPAKSWGIESEPDGGLLSKRIETPEYFELGSARMSLRIRKDGCGMSFLGASGDRLLETDSYWLEGVAPFGDEGYRAIASFASPRGERHYGLGQHQDGRLDLSGAQVAVWHDYAAEFGETVGVPFTVTNRGYGFVLDSCSRVKFSALAGSRTTWEAELGEALSFFVIEGDDADGIYAGYRILTGAAPLPPRAALGYIQCKQRYKSASELLGVARKYREKGYPCDILVVDWFHWKTLGDLALDPEYWPDAEAMNRELEGLGYKVMISCWPRFMKESVHYAELERKGWFMKDSSGSTLYGTPEDQRGALIDTTDPECGKWYWRTIRESYARRGFSYWWLDEDEPDVSPYGRFLAAGSGARVHNLYPLSHAGCVYEGHRRDLGDRCLILSRAAYLGSQRYGTTFWSSDVHPEWDVLRRQIPTGLNFCASGFPYWSSDIGGWHPLPEEKEGTGAYNELLVGDGHEDGRALSKAEYVELYVRWFEFGAFCPTFRAHGSREENEVWSYGEEAERILVRYLRLRYELLPYIYSLAYRSYRGGAPFMRALFMDFPEDSACEDIADEYMFGPAFLVAPVVEKGSVSRSVYLPAGAAWYDYWTKLRYEGGRTIIADAPLDRIPLYVRSGSIIPKGEPVQHCGIDQKAIRLEIYAGADGAFTFYRDDGESFAYERGEYEEILIRWDDAKGALSIEGDSEGLFPSDSDAWLVEVRK